MLKSHLFADFLANMTPNPPKLAHTWKPNGSSDSWGNGVGEILENGSSLIVEVSLRFKLYSTINQAEYEAIIFWITLVVDMGMENNKLKTNSLLVVSHNNEETQVNDPLLQRYLRLSGEKLEKFKTSKVVHVPCKKYSDIHAL